MLLCEISALGYAYTSADTLFIVSSSDEPFRQINTIVLCGAGLWNVRIRNLARFRLTLRAGIGHMIHATAICTSVGRLVA